MDKGKGQQKEQRNEKEGSVSFVLQCRFPLLRPMRIRLLALSKFFCFPPHSTYHNAEYDPVLTKEEEEPTTKTNYLTNQFTT